MTDEDAYRQEARRVLDRIDVTDTKAGSLISRLTSELWRFRQPHNKSIFLDEALHFVQSSLDKHLLICTLGPACLVNQSLESTLMLLQQEISVLPVLVEETEERLSLAKPFVPSLTHLHSTVQSAAGSRFASAHYSDAIQKACTALEKAVQVKSGQPTTATGTSVMTTAFSQKNALIHLANDSTEQFGFMNLYQGAVQALRNHFAHNLTELTDPSRALEWLGFISALFYKLDEAITPPAP